MSSAHSLWLRETKKGEGRRERGVLCTRATEDFEIRRFPAARGP
jgi:hypothetical protein